MTRLCIVILLASLLSSCSGTRHLPQGDHLYIGTRGIKIKKVKYPDEWAISDATGKRSVVYYNLWDMPNGSLGFPYARFIPFRLIFYNWFYTEKEKGFSYWMMNNFGEPPKTLRRINPKLKAEKIVNLYENWGHFGTTGEFRVKYRKRRPKAIVYYTFNVTKAYRYRKVEYVLDTTHTDFKEAVNEYRKNTLLVPGEDFNLDKIKKEKSDLMTYLHDRGFYYMRKNILNMMVDTTVGNRQIDLRMDMVHDLPAVYFKKLTIGGQSIVIDSADQNLDSGKFSYWPSGRIKKKLLDSLVLVKPGSVYSFRNVTTTIRNLNELGLFVNPNVSFSVSPNDSQKLNSVISAQARDASAFGFNVKGNYKSIGYIGPSVGVTFSQLNVFGGAENLTVDFDAFYDFPIGVFKENVSRSSGYSLNATLAAPMINPPVRFIKKTYSLPKKFVSVRAEINKRKDYFDMSTFTGSTGVVWKSRPKITHKLTLVEATFSDIINPTPNFDTLIADDPSLAASLVDQFILGGNYVFRFDNLSLENKRIGTYFEGKVELAGNLLSLISRENKTTGVKQPFGVPISQYVQTGYDFRTYLKVGVNHVLAFRHIGGIGYAYGNSTQMPYIKEYFIGGANSLRPVNARTVGPGRYFEQKENEVNQVGDLKLEWNLEYRMNFGPMMGFAIWSDAGNIWLLKPDPTRPNAEIQWNNIFKDSYLTAGLGLRVNIGFLTLRLDYGYVLYAPPFDSGKRWLWQNRDSLDGAVIGFGLPF